MQGDLTCKLFTSDDCSHSNNLFLWYYNTEIIFDDQCTKFNVTFSIVHYRKLILYYCRACTWYEASNEVYWNNQPLPNDRKMDYNLGELDHMFREIS